MRQPRNRALECSSQEVELEHLGIPERTAGSRSVDELLQRGHTVYGEPSDSYIYMASRRRWRRSGEGCVPKQCPFFPPHSMPITETMHFAKEKESLFARQAGVERETRFSNPPPEGKICAHLCDN